MILLEVMHMSFANSKIHLFIIHSVFEYSKRNNIPLFETWNRFEQFGIVNFLTKHYEIQHTLSMDQTLDDIEFLMTRNGSWSHPVVLWFECHC